MAGRPGTGKARAKGTIGTLRSGSLRVRAYAGVDPITGKRHDLVEIVPPGPNAQRQAEAILARFRREIEEKRNPRTTATVDQLLTRYLEQFDGSPNTLELYRTHVRNHISPCLGHLKVAQVDTETLDAFYGQLRRCRTRCSGGRRTVDHRVAQAHECDDRCRPHLCRPLAATTVRHIHFILSGAYKRAVRWRWVSTNPIAQAEPPPAPKANPQPPTAAEAARIVAASWQDPDWGTLVWTAMTTGARRGELCGVRLSAIDLGSGRETVWLRKAIRREPGAGWVEGDLKTHQQRRIALDAETAAVLGEHIERCHDRAAALGIELPADAFLFSGAADGSTFLTPDSVTQRYDRMVARLGIETTIHKLRHYSATELIAARVDPRTVAGRLGHGGGGTTTLKTYSAWVSEADQRAATGIGETMPRRPAALDAEAQRRATPRYPYEVIAAALGRSIENGSLAPDDVPSAAALAAEHDVSLATAKRALTLAREWELLARSDRATLPIVVPEKVESDPEMRDPSVEAPVPSSPRTMMTLTVRHRGTRLTRFSAVADPSDAAALEQLLTDAVARSGGSPDRVGEYEMDVEHVGAAEPLMTLVIACRSDR